MEKQRINVRCANCGKRMYTLNELRRHQKECFANEDNQKSEGPGFREMAPGSAQDISQDQVQCDAQATESEHQLSRTHSSYYI